MTGRKKERILQLVVSIFSSIHTFVFSGVLRPLRAKKMRETDCQDVSDGIVDLFSCFVLLPYDVACRICAVRLQASFLSSLSFFVLVREARVGCGREKDRKTQIAKTFPTVSETYYLNSCCYSYDVALHISAELVQLYSFFFFFCGVSRNVRLGCGRDKR